MKTSAPILLLVLCTWLLTWLAFGDLFIHPGEYLFVPSADGIKNYFSFVQYVKYGEGAKFSAMSYPFGDNVLYTDGQFIIAQFFRWVNRFIFPVSDYSVGIVNGLMLFSLALCPVFLFLILRKFRVGLVYAFFASLIIAFLSPQIQRFISHYSLSYAFYIPMLWYFTIRLLEGKGRLKWAICGLSGILFMGMIHPYYLPLGAFFLLSYGCVLAIQTYFSSRKLYTDALWVIGTALSSIVVFSILVSLLETASDRHPAPFGMFHYMSTFEGVFLPSFGPILDLWEWFTYVKLAPFEGQAYVGLAGFLVLIFTAWRFLSRLWKKNFKRAFQFTHSRHMNGMLISSTLMLILALALPFIYLPFVLDWLPQLKQFRSLGRFAWIFYYVFSVYTAYYFFLAIKALRLKGLRGLAVTLSFVLFLFWSAEAFINFTYCSRKIKKSAVENTIFTESNKDYRSFLNQSGYKASDFQAMLAFPYFHNGSEKFYIFRSNSSVYEAMKCVFDLNIPLATSLNARASLSHSYQLVQLMSNELIEKEVLPQLNNKPFLILVTNEPLKQDEENILAKSELIYQNDYIRLFKTPVKAFESIVREIRAAFPAIKDSLTHISNFYTKDSTDLIVLNEYEENQTPLHFGGKGALYAGKEKRVDFYSKSIPVSGPMNMEASVWIYSDKSYSSFPALFVEILDSTGRKLFADNFNPKFNTEIDHGWVRAAVRFPYGHGQKINAFMFHENSTISGFILDNFMIRPVDSKIYHGIEEDGSFFYNNYRIRSMGVR